MSETLNDAFKKLEKLIASEVSDLKFSDLKIKLVAAAAAPVRTDSDYIFDHFLPDRSFELDKLVKKIRRLLAADIQKTVLSPENSKLRLADLRAEMTSLGIDAFIIPLNDEFHGEAAPASSERLKWLTGFTGSAGYAAVLKDKAAIFVDGRYTLQVRQEVDVQLFEPCNVPQITLSEWFADNMKEGEIVGFDPWLHTESGVTTLKTALDKSNLNLKSLPENPIDRVWDDRPPAPLALVVPHTDRFSGQSSRDKRAEIADILTKDNVDAVVHTLPDATAWLLNIRGADLPSTPFALGFSILRKDQTVDLFLPPEKLSTDLSAHLGNGVRLHAPDQLSEQLFALKGQTVQIDPATTSQWIVNKLTEAGATITRAADPCLLPKATKNETELAGTRNAHIRDGVAVTKFLEWLSIETPKGTVDEISAEQKLYSFRAEGGNFKDTSFATISGAGPNGAIVHYRVTPKTNRKLEAGNLYLVDSGGQYLDGTTDITRTVAIGTPTEEMKDRFTRVLQGHIALALAKFPVGTTGSQLDALARMPLWKQGLDYDHGTGHGVGSYLSVHEGPHRISKMPSPVALRPGMILSNEPGYYKTGEYGIRIESLVAVKAAEAPDGAERAILEFETLTFAPIDKNAINSEILDNSEKQWLNAYHQNVWEKVSPFVGETTLKWLKAATAPI
ncbi:MAG: aminopeptidase P family protein [Pseudomonas marincola]